MSLVNLYKMSFGLCLQYIHIYTIYDKAHKKYSNKLKINNITITYFHFWKMSK